MTPHDGRCYKLVPKGLKRKPEARGAFEASPWRSAAFLRYNIEFLWRQLQIPGGHD
jgi:hypothetical protein